MTEKITNLVQFKSERDRFLQEIGTGLPGVNKSLKSLACLNPYTLQDNVQVYKSQKTKKISSLKTSAVTLSPVVLVSVLVT